MSSRFSNTSILILLTAVIAVSSCCRRCPDSVRVVAVGNSFTEDATEHYLYELLSEAGIDAVVGNCYIGGCTLQRHWENESSSDSTLKYSNRYTKITSEGKERTYNLSIKDILEDEPWDYVVFQQGKGLYGIESSHRPYLDSLLNYTASILGDYTSAYQMNWAFPQNSSDTVRFAIYDCDQKKMYEQCRDCALSLQKDPGVDLIIPTGTAIQLGRETRLGDTFNRDWGHLSYLSGRYTASCTWFEAITGIDVTKLSYRPEELSEEDAALCRSCAHKAVKSFRAKARL